MNGISLRCDNDTARKLGAVGEHDVPRFVRANNLQGARLSDFIVIETHEGTQFAWLIHARVRCEMAAERLKRRRTA